ncbi:MAG: cytochrome P450, partial [Erythrobacter sp.]|nr:cytochrome P450 [Erythrobacter sp.]
MASAANDELSINLFDPELQQCPYAAYKRLRDEAPVYNIPGTDMWVVSRYEHVREVLMDPERFSSSAVESQFRASAGDIERAQMVMDRFAEKGWVPAATLNGRDDPNHKQMRAMFNQAFKPSKIKEIDPEVERLSYDLIDGFIAEGQCEWVRQFCIPLPLFIIGEQMGAKREDIWKIKRWTDA